MSSANQDDPAASINRQGSLKSQLQQVAQSLEVGGVRNEERKAMLGIQVEPKDQQAVSTIFDKTETSLIPLSPQAKPSKNSLRIGNRQETGNSRTSNPSPIKNKNESVASSGTVVIMRKSGQMTNQSSAGSRQEGNESAAVSSRSKAKKDRFDRRGTKVVADVSDARTSFSQRSKPKPSLEEKLRIQQESKAIIWEQNKSLFVAGKTKDRILSNTRLTLAHVSFQPQNVCPSYSNISERVTKIQTEKERRLMRLQLRARGKSSETQSQAFSIQDSSKQKLLSLSNKGSFKMTNFQKTLQHPAMATVPEAQELATPINEKEVDGTSGESTHDDQVQKEVAAKLAINLQATEMTSRGSLCTETQLPVDLSMCSGGFGAGKALPGLVNKEDQKEAALQVQKPETKGEPNQIDKIMLDKLLRGEKAGGKYARVRIEENHEKESSGVFYLSDFPPKRFLLKSRGLSQPERKSKRKKVIQREIAKSNRLEVKLNQVVHVAKKRLANSPEAMHKFRQVVKDFHIEADVDSSEGSGRFDARKEMKQFRDNAEHQKVADQRLREKLVRLKKIRDTKDLQHVDSLIESAYNSAKASEWGKIGQDAGDPCPSFISESEFDIFSQSEDSHESQDSLDIIDQVKKQGRLTMSSKNNPMDEMKMAMLGFEPGFASADSQALIESVRKKIGELNGSGTVIPQQTQKVIYKRLCAEFNTAPLNVFKHYESSEKRMVFENYGLNAKQSQPISLLLPYIQGMRSLVMKHCNLSDKAASMIVLSSLGGTSELDHLDFTGIQMGPKFIQSIDSVLKRFPECLKELILADMKSVVSIGPLLQALQHSKSLQYLDLSGNRISLDSCEQLSEFIKGTTTLEFLSLKHCRIRDSVAQNILDALMLNLSVKYLDLSVNDFSALNDLQTSDIRYVKKAGCYVPRQMGGSDYIVAAKLGRLVQGHPQLLHVNLTKCQLSREELFYIVLSVRDSKNVQALHLSGNRFNAYDRHLMRALMPSKVRWPDAHPYQGKFEKISGRDKMALIMLNVSFMSTIPPNFMPELGLSSVNSVEDVRDKIRSYETRRQIQERVEKNNMKEFKRSEVHYKELIEQRLDTIQKTSKVPHLTDTFMPIKEDDSYTNLAEVRNQNRQMATTFKNYYADPDARIYDMFTMIDFYGRKKRCLELGFPLTREDDKWYRDQKHRLMERVKALQAGAGMILDPQSFAEFEYLKQQLRQLNFLEQASLLKDTNSKGGSPDKKLSQRVDSIASSSKSEIDAMLAEALTVPPSIGSNEEQTEQAFQEKLAKIKKDILDQKMRQKAIEKAYQDSLVIQRVKQLIELPPDYVNEKGAYANPMRKHQEVLVFSRVTGHPNAEGNDIWFDTSECWVCARHNKFSVSVMQADSLVDAQFEQTITLTAMMTKRMQKREEKQKADQVKNLEVLLEERSQKSANSANLSSSSGSGEEIEGKGHPAYINQIKADRKNNLFGGQEVTLLGKNGMMVSSKERFNIDQDDDEASQTSLERIINQERAAKQAQIVDKEDQSRSVNFYKYTEPRNLVQVSSTFNSQAITITQDPASNITLFNPHLTARPVQLKNVLKTVYQEYRGPHAPDRFNQPNHKYHAINGVLYRNLQNNQLVTEGLNRAAQRKSQTNTAGGGNGASSQMAKERENRMKIRQSGMDLTINTGTNALTKSLKSSFQAGGDDSDQERRPAPKERKHLTKEDLTQQKFIYNTEKFLTKFDIKDSVISKELSAIHDKETFSTRPSTQGAFKAGEPAMFMGLRSSRGTESGAKRNINSNALDSSESDDGEDKSVAEAHKLWLVRHGVSASGKMPPIRIKSQTRVVRREQLGVYQNQQRAGVDRPFSLERATYTADASKGDPRLSLKTEFMHESMPQQRLVQTSHGGARSLLQHAANRRQQQHNPGYATLTSVRSGPQIFEISNRLGEFDADSNFQEAESKIQRKTHVSYTPTVRPKNENEDSYKMFWAIFNQKEEAGAIYLVCSANHWMPIKLKDPIVINADGTVGNATKDQKSMESRVRTKRTSNSSQPKSITVMNEDIDMKDSKMHQESFVTTQTQENKGLSGLMGADQRNKLNRAPKKRLTSHFLMTTKDFKGKEKAREFSESPKIDQNDPEKEDFERFVIQKPGLKALQCSGHQTDLGNVSCHIERLNKLHEQKPTIQPASNLMNRTSTLRVNTKTTNENFTVTDFKPLEAHLFTRPGRQHFFFIRAGKHFMLSSRFPREAYKETNVQMNYVDVPKRGWRIDPPMVDRDQEWRELAEQAHEGDSQFDKQRSVFRTFRLDTPHNTEKMFENDFKLTKIQGKVKDRDQLAKVKATLLELYPQIKNMFLVLTTDSSYPAINKQDFDIWALSCHFQDRPSVDEAKINLKREASIVRNEMTKGIKLDVTKNDMLRFQFLECIFGLTMLCYEQEIKQDGGKEAQSPTRSKKKKSTKMYMYQAIQRLFTEHIDPAGFQVADTMAFREEYLYKYKVNQYLERNEHVLKKIHSEYNYAGKNYLLPLDAINFVSVVGGILHVKDRTVMRMYGFSKMSNLDFLKTPSFPKELYYVEFLEFFARLAFIVFEDDARGEYLHLELEERIDGLLAHYCKRMRLTRNFTLLPEHLNDAVQETVDYMKEYAKREVMKTEEQSQGLATDSFIEESNISFMEGMGENHRLGLPTSAAGDQSHHKSRSSLTRQSPANKTFHSPQSRFGGEAQNNGAAPERPLSTTIDLPLPFDKMH